MSCCVGNYDLCIKQGATYTKIFTWLAGQCCGAAGGGPAPVDLTGYSATMQFRQYAGSPTLLYDASADITLGGVNGTIELVIDATDTEGFTWWNGVYDLLLTSSSGIVTRLLSGTVDVCPGVTMPNTGQFVLLPGGQSANVPGGQGVLTP
jgi:hypothetical protein